MFIYSTTMIINFFAVTTISFMLALPFSMFFEVPFMNIEKFLLFPHKVKEKKKVLLPEKVKELNAGNSTLMS